MATPANVLSDAAQKVDRARNNVGHAVSVICDVVQAYMVSPLIFQETDELIEIAKTLTAIYRRLDVIGTNLGKTNGDASAKA
jgi:hypothetical protein